MSFKSLTTQFPTLLLMALLGVGCASTKSPDSTTGGNLALVDSENGFPDAQLGAPLESFQGLELKEDSGSFLTFRRPSDKLKIGRWSVDEINYNFYNRRLYSIQVNLSDEGSTKGILRDLNKKYGEPTSVDRREYQESENALVIREWEGQKVDLVYKYGSAFTGGQLIFLDAVTWKSLDAPRRTATQVFDDAMEGSIMNLDFD